MGKTTITIDEETLDRFKELKDHETMDDSGLTLNADAFLRQLLDTYEAFEVPRDKPSSEGLSIPSSVSDDNVDVEEIANELARQFDYAELSSRVAREITEELR